MRKYFGKARKINYQKTASVLLSVLLIVQFVLPIQVLATTKSWDFLTSSDYAFDNTKIEFSSGQAQLKATNSPAWYNSSWSYRRAITIDNTGNSNALTNYQISVALTASNFSFSKAQSAGQDVRFTDNDGTTLLNYYFQGYDSSGQTASIWVKVPSISASSSKTIYLYYGNGVATDSQSGANTFDLFDNFDSGASYWTRQGTVLSASTIADDNNVYEPTVIYEGSPQILTGQTNVFKMWYSSGWGSPNLNYAESTDGISWTKYNSNPIISAHNRSYIFKSGSTYYLYAANTANTQIDFYTSSDGVNFILDTSSAIAIGSIGQWDDTFIANSVVWIEGGNEWKMLYEARNSSGDGIWKMGLATSTDGRVWTKSASNPVISEAGCRGGPWINKIGSTYHLWLHGCATGDFPTDIYRYNSTDLVSWTESPAGNVFARQTSDEGVGTAVGQVADPTYLQYNGSVYFWYSASSDGTSQGAGQHIKLAIVSNKTFSDLVGSDEDHISPDTSLWNQVQSNSVSILNGVVTLEKSAVPLPALISKDFQLTDGIIESRTRSTSSPNYAQSIFIRKVTNTSSSNYPRDDASQQAHRQRYDGYDNALLNSTIPFANTTSPQTDNAWYWDRIIANGTTLTAQRYVDGSFNTLSSTVTGTDTGGITTGYVGFTPWNPGEYMNIDWVRVRKYTSPEPSTSSGSETTIVYSTSNPTINPTSGNAQAFTSLSGFSESAIKNGGQIKYQLSNDSGTTWYWWNGSVWATTVSGYTEASLATDINTNTSSFPMGSKSLLFRAYLNSDGTQLVQLNSIDLTYENDTTGPTGSITNDSGTPTNDPTPTFNLTIADAGVGISDAQMQFSCDNSTWSTWENYATPKTDFNVRTGAGCTDADGLKTVYVEYKDSLGNVGSPYNTGAFTLDTTSSIATLSNTPTSSNNTSTESTTSTETPTNTNRDLNIHSVKASSTKDTITITWKTDHNTASTVRYGTNKNLTEKKKDTHKEKTHRVVLTNLTPNTTYYFRIKTTDSNDNEDSSGIHSIATQAVPQSPSHANANANETSTQNRKPVENTQTDVSSGNPTPTVCSYTVASGDSLWSIAKKVYGDATVYNLIIEQNKEKYPNIASKLSIGQELTFGCSDTQSPQNIENRVIIDNSNQQTQSPSQTQSQTETKTFKWWNPFTWF